jgi:hypothetical protein
MGILILSFMYLKTGFFVASNIAKLAGFIALFVVIVCIFLFALDWRPNGRFGRFLIAIVVTSIFIGCYKYAITSSLFWRESIVETCEEYLRLNSEKKAQIALEQLNGWRYRNWPKPDQCQKLEQLAE